METDVSVDRIRLQMATLAELGVAGAEGLTAERIARRAELPEELVTSLYPDLTTLLYDSVVEAIDQTIGRAIDELPANLPATARLGLLSHRLWGALQLPALASIFRLVDVADDRHGAFEHLLEEMLLSRPRAAFRGLVAELVRSGDLRLANPEHKAYVIVALLFAYGLWYHFPGLYPLFTPQHPDKVVSHVLLVSLGTEAHARIVAASSGRSPYDGGRESCCRCPSLSRRARKCPRCFLVFFGLVLDLAVALLVVRWARRWRRRRAIAPRLAQLQSGLL